MSSGDVVPPGYHFTPTKQELIETYLLNVKNNVLPLQSCKVIEKNIYGSSAPWETFTDNDPWIAQDDKKDYSRVVYVYYKKDQLLQSKKNTKRKAGQGSWSGEAKGKQIRVNGGKELIGVEKKFTYEPNNTSEYKNNWKDIFGKWTMHEYTLAGVYGTSNYALCRIKNKKEVVDKLRKRKRTTSLMHDEDGDPRNNKKVLFLTGADAANTAGTSDVLLPPPFESTTSEAIGIEDIEIIGPEMVICFPKAEKHHHMYKDGFDSLIYSSSTPPCTQEEDALVNHIPNARKEKEKEKECPTEANTYMQHEEDVNKQQCVKGSDVANAINVDDEDEATIFSEEKLIEFDWWKYVNLDLDIDQRYNMLP